MIFKQNLTKFLNKQILEFRESLEVLEKTDDRNANYIIFLKSAWASEGEKSTKTTHLGTLKDAIEKAEKKFKVVNMREDVQADYIVSIRLGKSRYSVPEKYWERFKEKDN